MIERQYKTFQIIIPNIVLVLSMDGFRNHKCLMHPLPCTSPYCLKYNMSGDIYSFQTGELP